MAYADRGSRGRNRSLAIVTVAGLHGLALYGLVTGLGVQFIEDTVATFRARQIPLEPPPPLPEPSVQPSAEPSSVIDAVVPDVPLPPKPTQMPISPREAIPIPPTPFVADRIIDLPDITPPPSPSVTPRAVRPRNDPTSWNTTADYPTRELRNGEQGMVRYEATIGADGRVRDCHVTVSSGSPGLDAVTCRNVQRRARFDPATDASGAQVTGVYRGSIRWVIPND